MAQLEQSLSGVMIFVTAARAGSFTIAADRLGITKSAVGKSIAKLEDRLGTKLFHRTTRRLALTVDGEAYFASCSNAVDEIHAAEACLTSHQQVPRGRLRIDLPAAYGRHFILPVLTDISKRYPELQFTMTFNDSIIDPIEEGVDLLIRFGELKDSSGLVARQLTSQRRIICASPEYLAQHGTPECLTDLSAHNCIVGYRGGQSVAWCVLDETGLMGKFVPPATYEVGDGDAIVLLALDGLGLCQMPSSLVSPYVEKGQLVPVLEDYSSRDIEVSVVWPKTRHLLPKVRMVVDELVSRAELGLLA